MMFVGTALYQTPYGVCWKSTPSDTIRCLLEQYSVRYHTVFVGTALHQTPYGVCWESSSPETIRYLLEQHSTRLHTVFAGLIALNNILSFCLLVSSAGNLCIQYGPRSSPTLGECRLLVTIANSLDQKGGADLDPNCLTL